MEIILLRLTVINLWFFAETAFFDAIPPPRLSRASFAGQADRRPAAKLDLSEVLDLRESDADEVPDVCDIYMCIAKFATSMSARSE